MAIKNVNLRDYQEECIDVINNLDPGAYMAVLATGLGKTVIFSHLNRKGRMLIISHRQELVNQPVKYFDCPVGIEMGDSASDGEEVVSASIQTLARRLDRFNPDDFDIVITDEAHHCMADTYKKVYQYFKPRLHVGFTATPYRADNKMMGEVYEEIVFERNAAWGIENGWLSPIDALSIDIGADFTHIPDVDKNLALVDKAINTPEKNKLIADAYFKHAKGQTIIFTSTVNHAKNISALIPGSVVIDANTPNRSEIIADYAEGKIKCIVNCMIFTEGTDLPNIETVMLVRPTATNSLYTQMVGRGLRLCPGKTACTLIDCVGLISKRELCREGKLFFDLPEMNKEFNKKKSREPKPKVVPLVPRWYYDAKQAEVVMKLEQGLLNTGEVTWFFTCKRKGTGEVVTKILKTEDIQTTMKEIRSTGYTFVCVVSRKHALKLVEDDNWYGFVLVPKNLEEKAHYKNLDLKKFYSGLINLDDSEEVNDNITLDMIMDAA